jgi:hypothetical protein
VPAEAAVDEELRRRAEGNADDVLDRRRRHGEISGDLSEAIAGLEAIDEILDAGASVHCERLADRLP